MWYYPKPFISGLIINEENVELFHATLHVFEPLALRLQCINLVHHRKPIFNFYI